MANTAHQNNEREDQANKVEEWSRDNSEFAKWAMDESSERSTHNLEIMSQASNAMFNGMQDAAREMMTLHQEITRQFLMGSFGAFQANFTRQPLQRSLEGARRIGEILIRMSDEAQQAVDTLTRGRSEEDRGPRSQQRAPRGSRPARAA